MTDAQVAVAVQCDEHGEGRQLVEGPPSSFKSAETTGFGKIGKVELEPVEGQPDVTSVHVTEAEPHAEAEILLFQAEPTTPPDVSNVGHPETNTPPVRKDAEGTPFGAFSVTDKDSVSYPSPDELRGHVAVKHDGETAKCPICQHVFVP